MISRLVERFNRFMRRGVVWLLMATATFVSSHAAVAWGESLNPQQRLEVIEEAQQAYDRGIAIVRTNPDMARTEFKSAAERFQLVVNDGVVNGLLFYNLGNAYFQSGDLGRAIANFRRAEKFIAGDQRLQHNLKFARSQVKNQIAPEGTRVLRDAFIGWHERTTLRWRFGVFLFFHVILWGSLTLGAVGVIRFGSVLRRTAALVTLIWIVLGSSVAADLTGYGQSKAGVLVQNDVIVRKGNGTGFDPAFEQSLQAGVEFTLKKTRGDWLEIRLLSGDEGWIPAASAQVIP